MTGASVSLWVAVLSLAGTGVLALTQLLGKHGETRVAGDANLRDDQREFIATLRTDNAEMRGRVADLETARARDRRRIEALEAALRAARIPIPDTT